MSGFRSIQTALLLCAFCLLAVSAPRAAAAQTAAQETESPAPSEAVPPADEIFARVRTAWRRRTVAPLTRYKITAFYEASGKTFREDYHCFYRARDEHLKAYNVPVPPEENQRRLGGFAIWILGAVIDTNPVEHPPIRIPTPQLIPYVPLGLGVPGSEAPEGAAAATPPPSPEALRELGRVVSVNRIYAIEFAGVERVSDIETYHLRLTPLREPHVNKLRELWADTRTFDVVRLDVAGVDALEPLGPDAARIDFASIGGRRVIERIAALETIRAFRNVKHLVFSFREYEFPEREQADERYELNFTPPPR